MPSKFHQQQYYIASALFIVCLALYCYGPPHAREFLVGATGLFGGFITGKFSNGFKKPNLLGGNEDEKDSDSDSNAGLVGAGRGGRN